jgi:murein DD-endopeptidase MepM/ murein hydrolase activator NlpD
MIFPIKDTITSPFGMRTHPVDGGEKFHNGIDIRANVGTPIKAPDNGTVTQVYSNDAGGKQLIIKLDSGYTAGFAHLSEYSVKAGDKVKAGQIVAKSGNTGNTTGAHLHFTIKDKSGNFIDPVTALNAVEVFYYKNKPVLQYGTMAIVAGMMVYYYFFIYRKSQ